MKYALIFLTLWHTAVLADGMTNPSVTQNNIGATVCTAKYTLTIRPTSSYTQAWERTAGGNEQTVVDHIIPLCAGGHPSDYGNYQLQKKSTSYRKDAVEKRVCKLLCDYKITLKEAQGLFYGE